MIRSGVDLFQTPILKVRLMTYFRQNVWNCEILNVETGATALLGLGHGKFNTPVEEAPFVMTCLDTDDDWRVLKSRSWTNLATTNTSDFRYATSVPRYATKFSAVGSACEPSSLTKKWAEALTSTHVDCLFSGLVVPSDPPFPELVEVSE